MVSMVADMADDMYKQAARRGVEIDERLKHAVELAEKLTAPKVYGKINDLLNFLEQAPGLISMSADMADDVVRRATEKGIDIDSRFRATLDLVERLTAPQIYEKLNGLLQATEQMPGMVSMFADMADDTYRQAANRGIDIDERLRTGLELAEKLTAPDVLDKINQLLKLSGQAPGMVAMFMDILDEMYNKAAEKGLDPETMIKQGVDVTKKMTVLLNSSEFQGLMESSVFEPQTLNVLSAVSNALVESQEEPVRKVGIFGLMRSLRDPEAQKALGFLSTVLKNFGKNYKT